MRLLADRALLSVIILAPSRAGAGYLGEKDQIYLIMNNAPLLDLHGNNLPVTSAKERG